MICIHESNCVSAPRTKPGALITPCTVCIPPMQASPSCRMGSGGRGARGDAHCRRDDSTGMMPEKAIDAPVYTNARIICMSQEQLAEKANISRSHLSAIEAPNMVRAFSLDVFFNIADALDIDPSDLIKGSLFPDSVLK